MKRIIRSYFFEIRPVYYSFTDRSRKRQIVEKIRKLLTEHRCSYSITNKDIKLKIIFWYKIQRRRRCDLDNMVKVIMDAMTGVVYEDDCQVVEINAKKKEDKFLEGISLDIEIL